MAKEVEKKSESTEKSKNVESVEKSEVKNNKNPKELKNAEIIKNQKTEWKKFAIFSVIGAISTVLLGIFIQLAYDKFIIKPTQERTFSRLINPPLIKEIAQIFDDTALLNFWDFEKNQEFLKIQIETAKNQTNLTLNDLNWYQHQEGDGLTFGKFQYEYDHLIVTIRYIITLKNISLTFDASGYDHHKNNATHSLIFAQNGKIVFSSYVVDGFQEDFTFSDNDFLVSETFDQIKKNHIEKSENWSIRFENEYGLEKKNLPAFYKEMGRIALSTVINSLKYQNYTTFSGKLNKNFVSKNQLWTVVKTKSQNLRSLDEQLFPLMVTSALNQPNVERVLISYMNSVNDLNEIGTHLTQNVLQLEKIQQPYFFQFFKSIINRSSYIPFLKKIYPTLELIADETMRNSIGKSIKELKWITNAHRLFENQNFEETTSSLELNVLLEDMSDIMMKIANLVGVSSKKYEAQSLALKNDRERYWNDQQFIYGDLKNEKYVANPSAAFLPLIFGLIDSDSEKLTKLISSLENDERWTSLGYQSNVNQTASLVVNYLLLGSLKKLSEKSGPAQHKSHVLYSVLKNNLIAYTARSFKSSRFFYGGYDKDGKPQGVRDSNDGALILLIMAEQFI